MTKEEENLEEKIIELYEKVHLMLITPNQAREQFMEILAKERKRLVGEIEEVIKDWWAGEGKAGNVLINRRSVLDYLAKLKGSRDSIKEGR